MRTEGDEREIAVGRRECFFRSEDEGLWCRGWKVSRGARRGKAGRFFFFLFFFFSFAWRSCFLLRIEEDGQSCAGGGRGGGGL